MQLSLNRRKDKTNRPTGGCGSEELTPMFDNIRNGFSKMVLYIYKPVPPYSLGVVRFLFGLMMIIDIPDERGLHNIIEKFGDPMSCHFPLFHWWTPPPFEYIGLLYFIMWIGALGMCIGFKFRSSCIIFAISYWYLFLLDKTVWNNHSYLFGLVSSLFIFTSANHYFSIDAIVDTTINEKPVPIWNYWIIRFQFFLMYFYAGVKKFDPDWIGGYSMTALGDHWVFDPFRLVLSTEQIDLWIIHLFAFLFDLTVGFWLLWEKSRPLAILFSSSFHMMNSRMFAIGQFPYVCLVTTPIFCGYSWPKEIMSAFKQTNCLKETINFNDDAVKMDTKSKKPSLKMKSSFCLLAAYVFFQLFLPFSHNLTPGYNGWTNGLYGYSWDMMVHNWDKTLISVSIKDKKTGQTHFLDPQAWVRKTRYSRHPDMIVQYAACLKRNLADVAKKRGLDEFHDIEVYLDVWCSMNKRFHQRMVKPNQDILTAAWSPFKETEWLLPLLTELTSWRESMAAMEKEVHQWGNTTDLLFIADFPGMQLEHYVLKGLKNVTLTVLEGAITIDDNLKIFQKGDSTPLKSGMFHTINTISNEPSCIVFTYYTMSPPDKPNAKESSWQSDLLLRYDQLISSLKNLEKSFFKIAYNWGLISSF